MGLFTARVRARHRAITPWTRVRDMVARHRLSLIGCVAAALAVSISLTGPAAATGPKLPAGYTVNGIDVSSWQGSSINWSTVATNAKFVYAKATEGTTYINPSFAAQYTGAKAAGLFSGAYAFAHPNTPALVQADYFLDNARFAADGKTLPPMLDLEWPYSSGGDYIAPYPCWGLTPANMVAWIRTFVDEVKRRTGSATLIYTNANWWNPCTGSTTTFSDELLDIASFAAAPPTVLPTSWPAFTIWQFANSGSLPGDQNVYNGTLAQLTTLVRSTGCKRVPSDFNGDGFADVAIGEAHRRTGSLTNVGAVRVTTGGTGGLTRTPTQFFAPGSHGVPGTPVTNGLFGATVVSGYFNQDCYADLAIGAPGAGAGKGTVTILYGSAHGLVVTGARMLTGRSTTSRFGTALGTGDVNADGHIDLVIGAPNAVSGRGEIAIAFGQASGPSSASHWINESTSGIPGAATAGDHFGASLAVADITGDHIADIAVGVPGSVVGTVKGAGSVVLIRGARSTTLGAAAQSWSQATSGVAGTAATGDLFGSVLATADVTADGRADLVVGSPGDKIGSIVHEGSITLLPGASSGLTATGSQLWSSDSPGVPGVGVTNGQFGAALAMGDFNGDGHADLAVGSPHAHSNTGTVTIFNGKSTGLTGTAAQSWTPGTANVPGSASANHLFGYSLRAARISSGYSALIIGVPGDTTSTSLPGEGTVVILPGSATGLTTTGNQRLGESDLLTPANSGLAGTPSIALAADSLGWSLG